MSLMVGYTLYYSIYIYMLAVHVVIHHSPYCCAGWVHSAGTSHESPINKPGYRYPKPQTQTTNNGNSFIFILAVFVGTHFFIFK